MNPTPLDFRQLSEDYTRIERAIQFLEENANQQPELGEVAASIGLSEYHFQRLFSRWAGISPKRFLQYLTKEHAKKLLEGSSVLDTAYAVGLSGPGRLHDLLVNTDAVSPGEYKARGAGLTIRFGIHPTPFGECLIGVTARGICHLSFIQARPEDALQTLRREWGQARFVEDPSVTGALVKPIFDLERRTTSSLHLHLSGTNFQLKVWEALLHIPLGGVATYQSIARSIGQPSASRAVGNAIAHNPVAILIPCHRVLRKAGTFGNYHWGVTRKKALLGWEAASIEGSFA